MTLTYTMTPEEALRVLLAMKEAQGKGWVDAEGQHSEADDVLCAVLRHLGHPEIAAAWEDASGEWWWA